MPIYLIRHGQSQFNAAFTRGNPDPMIFDAPLTEKGRAQAHAARAEVAALNIQTVIVSPLTRAIQTAKIIFGETQPLTLTAAHSEQVSHSCDVGRTVKELQADFPDLDFGLVENTWWHQGPHNTDNVPVEPDETFQKRMKLFTKSLHQFTNRPVAIVGHGNAFREMSGVQMDNCQILKLTV